VIHITPNCATRIPGRGSGISTPSAYIHGGEKNDYNSIKENEDIYIGR
tara:strand:+ start:393 stop:536 length:144 start_codon:yes stop_codon:yes gene_type:complete